MADEHPTGGTPGDAAEGTDDAVNQDATGGTPQGDPEGTDDGQQGLVAEWKRKAELGNDALRRNQELEAEIERLRGNRAGQYVPPAVDPRIEQQSREMLETQQILNALQFSDDPRDKLTYRMAQQMMLNHQSTMAQLQLQQVPAEDRADTEREFQTGRYLDPEAAHNAVLGRRYRSDKSKLDKERAQFQQAAEARKNGVVGTARSPVSSADVRAIKERPRQEVFDEIDALYDQGRTDEARALSRKVSRREIKLS